jgi:WD40 repeat protein
LHPELDGVSCLAFSTDGKILAAAVVNGHNPHTHAIHLWDVASGEELRSLRVPQETPIRVWVNALAFAPDGKSLASVHREDNTVHLWDVATGKERQRLHGHRAEVFSVAFSPDGKVLASGSLDGTALIWNLQVVNFLFNLPIFVC